jgi:hypothetical protein
MRSVLRIDIACASCRASAVARAGRRVVARASKRISGSGRLKLRPKRGRRLSVKVVVRPDGGAATTVTRRVRRTSTAAG